MPVDLLESQIKIFEKPKNAFYLISSLTIEEQIKKYTVSLESKKIEWGIVGMGSMGTNLSRNFASNGYSLALYNRHLKGKEEQIALKQKKKFPELKNALAFESLANFVSSIKRPRGK